VIAPDPLDNWDEVCSVAFSPDGYIVAAKLYHSDRHGSEGIVLWDLRNGSLIKGLDFAPSGVYSIKFGPSGTTIGLQNGLICDIRNGNTFNLGDPDERIYAIAFSPNGEFIASTDAKSGREITLRDAITGNRLRIFKSDVKTGKELRFSEDGKTLVSAGGDVLQLWDVESGEEMSTIRPDCGAYDQFAYNPGGRVLAVTECGDQRNNAAELIDTTSERRTALLEGHASVIWSLDLSADSSLLATSSQDLTIKLWDTAKASLLHTLTGHAGIVRTVKFSPDGQTIASGGGDNETKIWSTVNGEEIVSLRAFKDGSWIVSTPDGYYNRSNTAAKYIRWRVGGKLYNESLYRSQFFRPEIVAQRLQHQQ
jgi:WD40 repeat protein